MMGIAEGNAHPAPPEDWSQRIQSARRLLERWALRAVERTRNVPSTAGEPQDTPSEASP